jgi:hypothetical protein
MKRDWDVLRQALTEIEEMPSQTREGFRVVLRHIEPSEEARILAKHIFMHIFMLYDAGSLTGVDSGTFEGRTLLSSDLTWEGHDLLATLRSQRVWERIKSIAQDKGIELTVDAVKGLGRMAVDWVVAK